MKTCIECQVEKEESAFDFNSKRKTTKRKICRKCRNKKNYGNYISKSANYHYRTVYNRLYMQDHCKKEYYKLYQAAVLSNLKLIRDIKNNKPLTDIHIEFKAHFEALFTPKMNWDNHGSVWQCDHITSGTTMAKEGCSVETINELSNLRPLLIKDNLERNKLG